MVINCNNDSQRHPRLERGSRQNFHLYPRKKLSTKTFILFLTQEFKNLILNNVIKNLKILVA